MGPQLDIYLEGRKCTTTLQIQKVKKKKEKVQIHFLVLQQV